MLGWELGLPASELVLELACQLALGRLTSLLSAALAGLAAPILILAGVLVSVAFLTLLERKVLASVQRRRGPDRVGFFGFLQPFADGLKLLSKETAVPSGSNRILFFISPAGFLAASLMAWAPMPAGLGIVVSDQEFGLVLVFAVSSLNAYLVILGGWSGNSRYSLLGSLRAAAQLISYEVSLGLIALGAVACTGSYSLSTIVLFQESTWLVVPLLPLFVLFYVSMLAETSRPPFDLPEAEAELVSGYNVEHSAVSFALYFIAEYANLILACALVCLLFLGGWLGLAWFPSCLSTAVLELKVVALLVVSLLIRASYPRYRYDQLMGLGWKVFFPVSTSALIFLASALLVLDGFPHQ